MSIVVEAEPVAEIDVPWPAVRFGLEVDGPHHLLPAQQQADRARDRLLATLGWVIVRFSTEEIEQAPEAFVTQVRAGLAAAIARAPAPWPGSRPVGDLTVAQRWPNAREREARRWVTRR